MKTLYFTRKFTKGHLKGLTHNDTISFPTAEKCLEWARKKFSDYIIVDYTFQKYWR